MKIDQKIEHVAGNVNNIGIVKWVKEGRWQFIVGIVTGIVTSYVASALWQWTLTAMGK